MASTDFTLLVVDDESEVRELLREALEASGYRVLTAADGLDALPLLGEETVDLLVTDLMMPGMDGRELVERARRRDPQLPVLMISGWAVGAIRTGDGIGFLRKPFSLLELRDAVAAALPKTPRSSRGSRRPSPREGRVRITDPGDGSEAS